MDLIIIYIVRFFVHIILWTIFLNSSYFIIDYFNYVDVYRDIQGSLPVYLYV